MKDMPIGERLIVAADYSPEEYGGIEGVRKKVLGLARDLKGTGVLIKVNSILRASGYGLVEDLHNLGVEVFADLKLVDIKNTMKTDGKMLSEINPKIVTVMGCAGIEGIKAVQEVLGSNTEVLVVTVLTSLDDDDCQLIFGCPTSAGVLKFARMAQLAGAGGLILSPAEIKDLKKRSEITLGMNAPNFRPDWSFIEDDDQNADRSLTIAEAFKNGAKRAVMGRAIINAKPNNNGLPQSPREAVELTLEEIKTGLDLRRQQTG